MEILELEERLQRRWERFAEQGTAHHGCRARRRALAAAQPIACRFAIEQVSSDFAHLPAGTELMPVDGYCLLARQDFANCEVKARSDADP
jgi:hypothetical protein